MHRIARPVQDRLCVGIDLHRDTLTVCALNPMTGEVAYQKFPCKCHGKNVEFFSALPRPHVVAIESMGFYRWLWDLIEPLVDELQLADAARCRGLAASRPKTDRQDALNVADLLASGRLPTAWAPPMHVRHLRDWTRHRNGLSRTYARILNRVQGIMNANNRPGPKRADAAALIRYIKAHGSLLPEHHTRMLWLAVEQIIVIERQIADAERIIHMLLAQPCFADLDRLLQSVPGVGPITSATAIAEIDNFTRFTDRKQIVRYAGLNPHARERRQTTRRRVSKAEPRQLRWVLQQAAWCARRDHEPMRKRYANLAKRIGKPKAGVALARKLLLCLWAVVRDHRPYRVIGQAEHAQA